MWVRQARAQGPGLAVNGFFHAMPIRKNFQGPGYQGENIIWTVRQGGQLYGNNI